MNISSSERSVARHATSTCHYRIFSKHNFSRMCSDSNVPLRTLLRKIRVYVCTMLFIIAYLRYDTTGRFRTNLCDCAYCACAARMYNLFSQVHEAQSVIDVGQKRNILIGSSLGLNQEYRTNSRLNLCICICLITYLY